MTRLDTKHAAHAAGTADELAELGTIAGRHRALVGIRPGTTMTDEQCRHHNALVADELERRDVVPGDRAWFTVQHDDGAIGGRWARSWVEAALECSFVSPVVWCVEDSTLAVYDEYFPNGRTATSRERFPVTPAPLTRAEIAMLEAPVDALF